MEGGPPIFRQDGSCPALLEDPCPGFPYGAVTRSGPPFQALPVPKTRAAGLVRFRSPLLAESRLMSVPPATEMFQFAGFASRTYGFSAGYPQELPLAGGLPHSEIPGSTIARISPGLFAACRVLHRLSVPRHPPDALRLRLIPRTSSRRCGKNRRAQRPAPRGPAPPRQRPRMKTLSGRATPAAGTPRAGQSASASVTSQLPLHPSINPRPGPAGRFPGRPLPDRNPCFSEHRHQTPDPRQDQTAGSYPASVFRPPTPGLCPPASVLWR